MVRSIVIVMLSIVVIGTTFWGYKEHQDKNAILIQAENTYQRSFHELAYYTHLLHDKIGTSLAMNSKTSLSPQLVEIWRISSEALANVGQLPLSLLPFNKTEEFLSDIGDFTYKVAIRDLDKEPLSKKEIQSLERLYKQSKEIKRELRQVQHAVLENDLRWMDVELALATQEEPFDNTIIDGFKTVEETVEGYQESNMDSPIVGEIGKKQDLKSLKGEKISKDEAITYGKKLFQVKNDKNIQLTTSGEGSDTPLYTLSYDGNEARGYLDMSIKGGHPITLLIDRPIEEKKISLNEGYKHAENYLKEHQFNDLQLYQSTEYKQIGVYSFIAEQDGVKLYPDALEVKVALDNGDILGFMAKNYLVNHKERDIPNPKWTKKEALKQINEKVNIRQDNLAIIRDELGEEVLTYEFLGTYEDDTFRIFINAMNGKEEKIEKLGGSEINYSEM